MTDGMDEDPRMVAIPNRHDTIILRDLLLLLGDDGGDDDDESEDIINVLQETQSSAAVLPAQQILISYVYVCH